MALASAGSIAQESPEALLAAALEHLGERRLDQAEEACKRLLASDPRHADALHLRGLISAQAGQLDPAIDFIVQAIRVEQTNPDYFLNLGRLLTHRARFDEALTSFDIALKLRPDFVAAWLALIIVNLLLIPGYFDVALRDFGLFLAALALGRLSQQFSRA